MFKSIATLIGLPKPLGMIFPNDKEKWFLEQRGYEVAEVKCSEDVNPTGTITIAFKKGEKVNKKDPDSLSSHQLNRVFVLSGFLRLAAKTLIYRKKLYIQWK